MEAIRVKPDCALSSDIYSVDLGSVLLELLQNESANGVRGRSATVLAHEDN